MQTKLNSNLPGSHASIPIATATQMAFIFEKLRRERDRKIPHTLMDQLFRASLSIRLNIAEGNGRWNKGDKRNFFWIARGGS